MNNIDNGPKPSFYKIKWLWYALIWATSYVTCSISAEPVSITSLVDRILKAPVWNYYDFLDGKDTEVLEAMAPLKELTTEECRLVVAQLSSVNDDNRLTNTWFKVLVINRLIYNIPPELTRAEFGVYFGGWGHPVMLQTNDSYIWPLYIENGRFRIAARSGGYSGPNYRGLEEFDYLSEKFERRKDFILRRN